MCMIDGDEAEFWRETQQRASKPHKCDECGRVIEPGEQYWKSFCVQEGLGFRNKTCAHCHVGQLLLSRECHGFIYEMVREDLEEHARQYGTERLPWGPFAARLVVGMRRGWQRFRGGLMPIPELALARSPPPPPPTWAPDWSTGAKG